MNIEWCNFEWKDHDGRMNRCQWMNDYHPNNRHECGRSWVALEEE